MALVSISDLASAILLPEHVLHPHDGSTGEVELPEFIQIMTLTREAEQEASFWGDKSPRRHSQGGEAVPLHYLTAAYRRKRTLDAVMDPELRQVYVDSPTNANNRQADLLMHDAFLHGCVS